MKQEIKQEWIKALRSGKYEQTTGQLKFENSYCCLGVLCELHRKHRKSKQFAWDAKNNPFEPEYEGNSATLPNAVVRWAGLDDKWIDNGNPIIKNHSLSFWNDGRHFDFDQIANLIERNL